MAALLLLCATSVTGSSSASDDALTLIGWGGAYMDAQRNALFTPFEQSSGSRIAAREYSGDLAALRAQVAAGSIDWDVVAVDEQGADEGCREGWFEQLSPRQLPPGLNHTPAEQDFLAPALHDCAVGGSVRALLFFHLDDAFASAPRSLSDVFDTQKYPGKRALPRSPRGNLEWALMADGVPASEVYAELQTPGGASRAFGKLTRLRPHIVWWREVPQSVRSLTDGTVTIAAANHEAMAQLIVGTPVAVVPVWSGQLWEIDYWAIVKGAPRPQTARKFLAFATGTLQQVEFARVSAHGPVRRSALTYTQPSVAAWLPSADGRLEHGLRIDADWWVRNRARLNEQFREWWRNTQP
ncbi:MAG: extracellular solute-binding protein [Gammaproteobacteria bacterium]|nr:extracellular solute-binding protein [Gammaproteobacteria bacterium]